MEVGGYQVTGTLGKGGMGVVYHARGPRGEVALKLLPCPEGDALARFERERRLLLELGARDGFVPILDAGSSLQGPFIVMPILAGGTLRDRLLGPLGVDEALELGRTLARALGAAHARGIVHRDVKPENILFDTEGRAYVADLGIAKHFRPSDSVSLSKTGALRGSAGYMAPEQYEDSKSVGPPADVFAVGAILYEALTGSRPFTGDTILEALASLHRSPPAPLRTVRPDVPKWLARVVERALSPDARHRHENGNALLAALEEPAPRTRSRWPIVVAALVPIVAGGVTVALFSLPDKKSRAAAEAAALVAKASQLRTKNDLAGALAAATRACELDPALAAAWGERCRVHVARKEHDLVETSASRWLELIDTSEARLARGESRFARRRREEARADFDRALVLDPRSVSALVHRSVLRLPADRAGAIADLSRALEIDPRDPLLWAGRAGARADGGDPDGAIADATRAIELDAKCAEAWVNRAAAHGEKGEIDKVLADSARAIELDPKIARAWMLHANSKSLKGDTRTAVVEFRQALALEPDDPSTLAMFGALLVALNQLDEATTHLDRALALDPRNHRSLRSRGVLRWKRGDKKGALADLDAAIGVDPTQAADWSFRGTIRTDVADAPTADLELALVDFTKAIELEPRSARHLAQRGAVLYGLGRCREALPDLDAALALDPNGPGIFTRKLRGFVRDALGDTQGAVEDWRAVLAKLPRDDEDLPRIRQRLAGIEDKK